jgi:hypothetical protein
MKGWLHGACCPADFSSIAAKNEMPWNACIDMGQATRGNRVKHIDERPENRLFGQLKQPLEQLLK